MSTVKNITILESLFFGIGKPSSGIKAKRLGKNITTQLPLTKDGEIKAAKPPHFKVGLGAVLINPKKGLILANYATKFDIEKAYQDGREMVDPLFDLPDPFMDALGEVNDKIENLNGDELSGNGQLAGLLRGAIEPSIKVKKLVTMAELKAIKGWGDIADGLDADDVELLSRVNASEVSLDVFIREAKLNLGID